MINKITSNNWARGKLFWILLIALCVSMESVALVYQYLLNEPPCILCIHFRLLFVLIILIAIFGLLFCKNKVARVISLLGIVASFGVMTERAYQLLGTERGFVLGDCSVGLNFPNWLAVDKWIPWLFQPMTSCGYTPEIIFGITMAEVLMLFTVVMTLLFSLFLIVNIRK